MSAARAIIAARTHAASGGDRGRKVRFGGFSFGSWRESQSHEDVLTQMVELAVQADRLGLDSFWLGEHDFSRHGILADTMVMASHIAAKTERIRIGTAVIVLPLHNPVRVAEQVAIVDHLSGGRIDVGVGIGYQRREFAGLGIDIDEARARFVEGLEVMIHAWTSETLVYEGEYTRLTAEDDVQVYPKPLQRPHPPVYQAVSTTPSSVELAASRGVPIIVGGPTDVLGRAPQVIALWREKMREHGNDPEGYDLPCLQNVFVAETDEAAHTEIERIDSAWGLKVLQQVGSPIGRDGSSPEGYEQWVERWQQRTRAAGDPTRTEIPQLFGSPETVAGQVEELRRQGIENICGRFTIPGIPFDRVQCSMELFATEVAPRFQDADAPLNPVRVRAEAGAVPG